MQTLGRRAGRQHVNGPTEIFLKVVADYHAGISAAGCVEAVCLGRPQVTYGGRQMNAARAVALECFGPPEFAGLEVLHKCYNAKCLNPDHLAYGTTRENAADTKAAGNYYRPLPSLSVEQVRAVDGLYARGRTQAQIAELFGVSQRTISDALNRVVAYSSYPKD